jgi:hypothetical protein
MCLCIISPLCGCGHGQNLTKIVCTYARMTDRLMMTIADRPIGDHSGYSEEFSTDRSDILCSVHFIIETCACICCAEARSNCGAVRLIGIEPTDRHDS